MIRSGMELIARGRDFSGSLVSAAVVPTSSIPTKANTAIWKPAKKPLSPFGNQPPSFHRWAKEASTPVGDLAEVAGIVASFGDHVYDMNISSTKSMTGHLLGAAGAIEGLACIMAITKGIVPPTINVENLDPKIDPKINLTLNKAQKRDVKYALSNTFGFGGHNSTVIFKKI